MPASSDNVVISLDEAKTVLGGTYAGDYVAKYVGESGCKQAVLERNYIDKDYLVDYANYYSRSFDEHARWVQRIHFFDKGFTEEEFLAAMNDNRIGEMCGNYLGFSVVKPIRAWNGHYLIGRTLLRTYPEYSDDRRIRRFYLENDYKPHLFGNEMRIRSLPFQSQDGQASACATVALWAISHALSPYFGTRTAAPSEITSEAASSPPVSRCYPSLGLNLQQMLNYLRAIELESDVILVCSEELIDKMPWSGRLEHLIAQNVEDSKTTAQAYIQAKFPIIATLVMVKYEQNMTDIEYKDYHAVVITGFGETADGHLQELYLHDDGIGPYCRVDWPNSTPELNYEWNNPSLRERLMVDYDKIFLETLIVPVYPKFRLPSDRMVPLYSHLSRQARELGFGCRLMFFQVSDYKADLIRNRCADRRTLLLRNLPRFLAVTRFYDGERIVEDHVYDATATRPSNPTKIPFVAGQTPIVT